MKSLMSVPSFVDARYMTDFFEKESRELKQARKELLKDAAFLELDASDEEHEILPSPAFKKAKLSLGTLTSSKRKETVSSFSFLSTKSPFKRDRNLPVPFSDWWGWRSFTVEGQRHRTSAAASQLGRNSSAIRASSSPSGRFFSNAGQISTPAVEPNWSLTKWTNFYSWQRICKQHWRHYCTLQTCIVGIVQFVDY